MGFPSNIKIIKRHIGIKRLGLLQYTGEPLIDVIAKFKDNKNSLNTVLKNLILTVATLHKFGIYSYWTVHSGKGKSESV